MDAVQKMENIIHEMLDISQRLRANYWTDLEISECSACGYTGKVGA